MVRSLKVAALQAVSLVSIVVAAPPPQRVIPRPPAQAPGPPRPEDGRAAPDGYAPIPEWLGQTRAASGEDCGLRGRNIRGRTVGRVLFQLLAGRPGPRRRAAGAHQDRLQGR